MPLCHRRWPRRRRRHGHGGRRGQRHGGPTSSAVAFAGAAPRSPPRRPPDEVGRCAGPSRLRSARLCGGRSRSRWRHGQGGRRGRRRCLDTGTGTAPQPRRRATTRPMDSSASADARPDAAAPRIALFAAAATDSVRPGLATTGDVRGGLGARQRVRSCDLGEGPLRALVTPRLRRTPGPMLWRRRLLFARPWRRTACGAAPSRKGAHGGEGQCDGHAAGEGDFYVKRGLGMLQLPFEIRFIIERLNLAVNVQFTLLQHSSLPGPPFLINDP